MQNHHLSWVKRYLINCLIEKYFSDIISMKQMSSSKNQEFKKTSFLSKSNSEFIEQMYVKFINKDSDLPESWFNYFEGIGDELNIIVKEINGPSWGLAKPKINIDELKKKLIKKKKIIP